MDIKIREDERARIEAEMVPFETTIKYCKKLYDDYKQERKEMNERRESIDENEKHNNGEYGNELMTKKKMSSVGSQHKRNASGRNDNTHAPPKSLTA